MLDRWKRRLRPSRNDQPTRDEPVAVEGATSGSGASELPDEIVAAQHNIGQRERVQTRTEDICLCPDYRTGARAVSDGEAAFLTFVVRTADVQ
jgi:hypothetical protein